MVLSNISIAIQGIILLQDAFLIAHRSSVKAHDLGLWAFASSVLVAIVLIQQLRDLGQHFVRRDDPVLVLRLINLILIAALAIANVSLPRRPDVYYRGETVDQQFTVSVINRYTWSWVYALIDKAGKTGDLTEKDVPQPDHILRVDSLIKEWHDYAWTSSLVWSLFKTYRSRLFLQWFVISLRCLFGIGPFWTLMKLINSLGDKVPGQGPSFEMWTLVFWLGFFSLGEMVRRR